MCRYLLGLLKVLELYSHKNPEAIQLGHFYGETCLGFGLFWREAQVTQVTGCAAPAASSLLFIRQHLVWFPLALKS